MLWSLCSGAGRSTKHTTPPPSLYPTHATLRRRCPTRSNCNTSTRLSVCPSLLFSLHPLARRYRDRTSVPKSRHPLPFSVPSGCHLAASRLHLSTFPDTSTKHAKQASTHSHLLCAVCMGILPRVLSSSPSSYQSASSVSRRPASSSSYRSRSLRRLRSYRVSSSSSTSTSTSISVSCIRNSRAQYQYVPPRPRL
ncbi:hypothetical protein FA13DRAFT_242606 [Coprinellus micaceus]|uniref:Uncharacterized protein n=1 Tax=Coprinellus micaceus TaxID=71717 RepID=A0A4Y7SES2_COPMI|nr:hypothetical protein FA13DRAFT_242606 [Coprinellus micaceus]